MVLHIHPEQSDEGRNRTSGDRNLPIFESLEFGAKSTMHTPVFHAYGQDAGAPKTLDPER